MDRTQQSITCDGCGDELLKESGYPHEYGLVLKSYDFNVATSGVVFSILQEPVISQDCHFCGFECLDNWRKRY